MVRPSGEISGEVGKGKIVARLEGRVLRREERGIVRIPERFQAVELLLQGALGGTRSRGGVQAAQLLEAAVAGFLPLPALVRGAGTEGEGEGDRDGGNHVRCANIDAIV